MAGWGAFGGGLAQGFGQAIGPAMRQKRWEKRKEEEEERARKTALNLFDFSTTGADKDEKLREQGREFIRLGGDWKDARAKYRAALKAKADAEAKTEAGFKMQPLGEKGRPVGGKAPTYPTQQLIKETQRLGGKREKQKEQEQRQFGQAQGMTGKKLEYFTSRPNITESQLGRLTGKMREKPEKPKDITTDARAVYQGQQQAYTLSPRGQQEITKKAMDNLGLTPADIQPPVFDTTMIDPIKAGKVYDQQQNAYEERVSLLNEEKKRILDFEKANTKVDAILNNPRGTMAGDNKDLETALEELLRELLVEWDQIKRELRE